MMSKRIVPVWLLLLFVLIVGHAQAANLTVSVIDVGQGDSIFVEFPDGRNMLVDAGPSSAGDTVVGYLKSRSTKRIDIAVATHPHEDHIDGMVAVLRSFPVGKFWDSGYVHGSVSQREMLSTIKEKGIRFGTPKSGFSERIGRVEVSVLAPRLAIPGEPNNNSLVLRIVYENISFILAGDMESEERHTVSAWPKSTVLKVGHHGSTNGTDFVFLRQVKPEIAVISCGLDNPYGHPHRSTLDALKAIGAITYITAQTGTVVMTSDGNRVTVKTLGSRTRNAKPGDVATYIGNRNSRIFHRPSCSSLPAERNRLHFRTREEAVQAGHRPCKRCKP